MDWVDGTALQRTGVDPLDQSRNVAKVCGAFADTRANQYHHSRRDLLISDPWRRRGSTNSRWVSLREQQPQVQTDLANRLVMRQTSLNHQSYPCRWKSLRHCR